MEQIIRFRCSHDFVKRLDEARGGLSRSQFIRAAVEVAGAFEALEGGEGGEPNLPPKIKYGCPYCSFKAPSPKARCPRHPGELVAV